jgi:hypothetical protein
MIQAAPFQISGAGLPASLLVHISGLTINYARRSILRGSTRNAFDWSWIGRFFRHETKTFNAYFAAPRAGCAGSAAMTTG